MEQKSSVRLAIAGFILSFPALLIVSAGLLEMGLGLRQINNTLDELLLNFPALNVIIHPVVVVGGLILSIGLNVIPVFRLRMQAQAGALVAAITAQLKASNIAAALLSAFLFAAIACYAFGENFRIVAR